MKSKAILSVIVFLISILLTLSSSPLYTEKARGVTDDTIKLGVIVDLTGPVAVNTIPYLEGVRNYFRYTDEQGGINGRKGCLFLLQDGRSLKSKVK